MANIIVTGSSKGFGYPIVKTLLKDGHRVIAGMRGVDGKNNNAAAELKAAGASPVEMDLTEESSVARAVASAGALDVVVFGLQENFTPVDRLGMGAAVDPYNQAADNLQKKVYAAFGMSEALTLKT